MRDILFRGKIKGSDEWTEGNLNAVKWYFDASPITIIIPTDAYLDSRSGQGTIPYIEVYPETVSEYINIKDKNSKRIFEGDIVRFRGYYQEPHWIGTVTYDERNALYLFKGVMPYRYDSRYPSEFEVQVSSRDKDSFEVLGNKWDNPELLGEDGYIRARDSI